jgi:4'-phosphopantetheinyl transferase
MNARGGQVVMPLPSDVGRFGSGSVQNLSGPSVSLRHGVAGGLRHAFDGAWRQAGLTVDGGNAQDPEVGHTLLALFFDLAAWRPWLHEALSLLDDAERARVHRKHRPDDRDELALSYALHRLVLGSVLGEDPAAVALDRDAAGRPCLAGDALHTSLSHADGFAAVAVSRHGAVGIDLELATRTADMLPIADHIWHPDEAKALASLPESEQATTLLQLWVRKEALLKAAGIGLSREMHSFVAPADQPLPLPLADGGDAVVRAIVRMLDVGPAWLAALASVDGNGPRVAWLRPLEQ